MCLSVCVCICVSGVIRKKSDPVTRVLEVWRVWEGLGGSRRVWEGPGGSGRVREGPGGRGGGWEGGGGWGGGGEGVDLRVLLILIIEYTKKIYLPC